MNYEYRRTEATAINPDVRAVQHTQRGVLAEFMSAWLLFVSLALTLGCFAAAYILWNASPKVRVLPPPSSKKTEPSYEETNSLAKLFLEVLALKASFASWPTILKNLNQQDEPHIRTLLLELRMERVADPSAVLGAIERVCIAAKRENPSASRVELLERALSIVRETKSR